MKLLLLTVVATLLIGVTSVHSEQGLNYKYYEGAWSVLPDFNALTPVKSGTVSTVNLDQRRREKQYGFLYQGYITIPAAGNYTFETYSDDGSKLYIGTYDNNATALVNNDGLHGAQTRSGTIALNAGVYPITLTFFQNDGNQSWEFYWSSNTGIGRQKIPDYVLTTTSTTTVNPPASGAGLNYSYYEGSWSSLPDFTALTPVKTGVSANIDLGLRNRDKQFAIMWQGYINIPVSGSYSFQSISDDGSKVYVGSTASALVNNDGLHASQANNASVTLNAGLNPIIVTYFQNEGSQQMELYWASTSANFTRQRVPDNVLSTSGTAVAPPTSNGSGLSYNYYEGAWSNLPDFSTLTPVKSGVTTNIDLAPRNREKQYAFVWQGNINIPTAGNYSFETISDDGSKVFIGSSTTPLVNNDGLHASQSRNGTISLNAGLNPITVIFFQNEGNQVMELYWASNTGISRQKVPDNVLSVSTTVVPPVTPPTAPVEIPPVVTPPSSGSGGLTGVNNYYFSSTGGDDSRSAAQAKNPSTPWRTISKLNSVMGGLLPGDAALFNRGDVFDGAINVTTSGIIISAYGNGNKPVINGFTTLSNWTSIGNGVWQAACPSGDKVNMVALNGVAQAMGRYPNITEPNRGYLTYDAHSGTSQITDYQLSGSTNWTGAEVVIRKNNWVLDRCLITNHSGNNINYNTPTSHEPVNGYGYFIQNSPQTLDQLGEWYFDPSQRVLKMYFGSNNPNSYDVKASTVNTLALVSYKSNIIIDNIAFVGGDDYALKLEYSQGLRVQNCTIDLSGTQAVSALNLTGFNLESNAITNTSNDAIDCNGNTNSAIRNNTIKNTGMLVGMGQSGNQQYNAILIEGSGNTVELNSILNTGYSGITFSGESCLIKNNYVNGFCLTIEDGGGIYTWGDLTKYNRKIIGNIIVNGIGSFEGTTYQFSTGATGIFHDDESANVEMTDNTLANCSRAGIFFHNSHDMSMSNNTVFNNRTQITMVHDPISVNHPIRNLTLNNNILFSRLSSQFIMEMGSITNDLASFGNYNNNYYSRPIDDNGIIYTYYREASGSYKYAYYDVDGWKSAYNAYDQQSKASPVKIPSYIVNSYNGGNRYTNGSFNNNTGNIYCLSSPGKCSVTWNSGGRLDGGAVQINFDGSGGAINNVGSYADIGSIQAGRNYQIKFSLLGAQPGKTVSVFLLDGTTYARLSDTRYFDVSTSRSDNEFLFTAPSSASTTLLGFEISGPDIPLWIDNLQVYDVNTTITNPDDYIRFLYNPSTSTQSFNINGNYVDAKNNSYAGKIDLAPFTSAVLIRQSGGLLSETTERQANTAVSAQIVQEVAEINSLLTVNVSPNPTRNNLQINLTAPQGAQKTSLSINAISGALMKTIPVTGSTQRLNVDVSTWATGVYIINYVVDGHTIYKKFVKQ